MRFFHLADLHLGLLLRGFSLIPDQRYILEQIIALADAHRPDALVIAGDLYDRQQPPVEAVRLLDYFLTALSARSIPVLIISGNHDSPERLGFAGDILQRQGIYLSAVFDGSPRRVTLTDAQGAVDFWLLPYLRPGLARPFFPDSPIQTTHQAVEAVLRATPIDPDRRNVLVAHQFVTAGGYEPERSESETSQVGGLDAVDAGLFDAFDYVALGHLHKPQRMGRDTVRYAGSPLKYSFSEWRSAKTMPLVTLEEGGQASLQLLPLSPLRDLRPVEGPLEQLLREDVASAGNAEDFLQVTLTDREEPLSALARLRRTYPHVLSLRWDGAAEPEKADPLSVGDLPRLSPQALFSAFCEAQMGAPPPEDWTRLFDQRFGEEGPA